MTASYCIKRKSIEPRMGADGHRFFQGGESLSPCTEAKMTPGARRWPSFAPGRHLESSLKEGEVLSSKSLIQLRVSLAFLKIGRMLVRLRRMRKAPHSWRKRTSNSRNQKLKMLYG